MLHFKQVGQFLHRHQMIELAVMSKWHIRLFGYGGCPRDAADEVLASVDSEEAARAFIDEKALEFGAATIVERIGGDGRQQFILRRQSPSSLAELLASPCYTVEMG